MTAESMPATELFDFPVILVVFDEYFQDLGTCLERVMKLETAFQQERPCGVSPFATVKFAC
jgi:hypothetical protein